MITSHKLFVVQELQGKGIRYFLEDATGKADGGKGEKGNFLTSRKK